MTRNATRIAAAAAAGLLALVAGPPAGSVQAQDFNPGIHLSVDEIRALAGQVRAGRSLQPAAWP